MQLKHFYNVATKVSSRKKCYYFWWSTRLLSILNLFSQSQKSFYRQISVTRYRHHENVCTTFVPLWIEVCISAAMLWSCLSHVRDIISPLRYVARICHNDSCGIRNTRSQSDKTYHQKSRSLEAAIFGLSFSTSLKFDYNKIACKISEKCEEVNVKFQSITKNLMSKFHDIETYCNSMMIRLSLDEYNQKCQFREIKGHPRNNCCKWSQDLRRPEEGTSS